MLVLGLPFNDGGMFLVSYVCKRTGTGDKMICLMCHQTVPSVIKVQNWLL